MESWRVMYSGTLGFREFIGKRVALFRTSYIKRSVCVVWHHKEHTLLNLQKHKRGRQRHCPLSLNIQP